MKKKKLTGGKKKKISKKKNHSKGNNPTNTVLRRANFIKMTRVRGGNFKFKAISLGKGSFQWKTMQLSKNSKILSVLYNQANLKLVQKRNLSKGTIIKIDSMPFIKTILTNQRSFIDLLKFQIDKMILLKLLNKGLLIARITSRPGQTGKINGTIMEDYDLKLFFRISRKMKKLIPY
ncbi:ribosomal protein S8 (nucleomorph) [Bigelowiella natans]|uniref:40S ribosomal protein S8 n=1 Tax=Bigelowiella natans TaxID=227086 RepID=Q3LVX9_BIGNA|nr:ribosomal protein S8 [Bigelowiella natans]ABA27387.1 ribosomal protein S8 [Bigelowiella natans]|mmetsp:Transcript_307/g.426  ORF Transcript_307/g.426 Transcript_307/m.426 type:complete len:177 (+) Transcript_307:2075-2605(+)